MAKIKGEIKVKAKKKPVKAGSSNKGGNGGIFTAKTSAIVRKKKNK